MVGTTCFANKRADTSAGERTSAMRCRTAYRDTVNFASNGGAKLKPQGVVYAGPIALRYNCLGASLGSFGGTGAEGGNECAAFYIKSASSYSEMLSVTRGMYAGHWETHVSPNPYIGSLQSNSDTLRNVLPATNDANEIMDRHNHLVLNSDSGTSTQNLLKVTPLMKKVSACSGSGSGSTSAVMTNAAYDALQDEPVDAMRCAQFPPDPRISLVYGGYGCEV